MAHAPSYTMHDGFRMPMGFPVAGFASAMAYQARAEDIFISTYPKCGTTWMQHIVWLLLHDGQPLSPDQAMTEVIPHLEEVGADAVRALPEPRVIKTHLPFEHCPYHDRARFIYVARNPFDCAVSFFHHTRGFVAHYDFADGTFDDYFECFIRGEVDFGDYFENVLSWMPHFTDENFFVVTYERMQDEPHAVIGALGAFLGGRANAAVNDTAIIERVIDHSSFSSMAKEQQRWSSRRPDGMPPFVRKGVVGDWRNHFSSAQTRRMLDRINGVSGGPRLASMWPQVMAAARAHV